MNLGNDLKSVKEFYEITISEMERLAKHGYEFLIFGTGAMLFSLGILANIIIPSYKVFSEDELLVITIFGLVCIVAGVWIWRQKAKFKLEVHQAKLDWKKFYEAQRTERLKITNESKSGNEENVQPPP